VRDNARTRTLAWPEDTRIDADLVEALVEAGRLDDAAAALLDLQFRTAANRLPWGIAAGARAEAIVRLAQGEPPAALRALGAAAATIESLPYALERGRCLLAWGASLRAAGRRNAARAALTTAREAIARLPSPPWEARVVAATAELRRG
jgi:hypothetical protein